jgi:hypothetical protein
MEESVAIDIWRGCILVLASLGQMILPARLLAAAEIFVPDPGGLADTTIALAIAPPVPASNLPVLFVHGHDALNDNDSEFNYRKNWIDQAAGLTSFLATINAAKNAQLGIEPYFIRFQDQIRSIRDDALDIDEAVKTIIARHDPDYDHANPNSVTPVQVVIIGYSKGTLSSRLYLKSLQAQEDGFPPPKQGYRPISEFIAIAPPNHGISPSDVPLVPECFNVVALRDRAISEMQLNNGYFEDCTSYETLNCDDAAQSTDFIADLNGHAMQAGFAHPDPQSQYADEAPGSRANGAPREDGILYVTLYAANGDFVGGSAPSGDCQGRKLAKNFAPDAVNIDTINITGTNDLERHANTMHTPEIICLTLYTAVHHRVPTTFTDVCDMTDGIPEIPLPERAAAVLALDVSGSMGTAPCNGCAPKIEILKDAVALFADLWGLVATPGDRLGVTFFSSAVSEFVCNETIVPSCRTLTLDQITPQDEALVPLLHTLGEIKTNLQGHAAGGTTAMGGALENAIQRLSDFPTESDGARRVILFTDGMQNVSPLVEVMPPGCAEADCQYRIATTPPRQLDLDLGVPVDTIGVGAGDAFLSMLNGIASRTGGHNDSTLNPQQDLRRFFVEKLVNALRGFSPQLIDYRPGVLKDDQAVEDFDINRGARRIILKLSWPRGQSLDFRVDKDGLDLTQAGVKVEHDTYRLFALDMPAAVDGQEVVSEGRWSMQIRGRPGISYQAAAMADEPSLSYRTSLGARDHVVGDALELELQLTLDGQPLVAPAEVTAVVFAPGESLGNLLAETSRPATPDGFALEPGTSLGQEKLQLLLLDERFRVMLQPVSKRLDLQHHGGGVYRASTSATALPGPYKVVFEIRGEHPRTGPFTRTETRTTHVEFGVADLDMSELVVESTGRIPEGRKVRLRIRPRDALGNFLGPDYGHRIQVSLDGRSPAESLEDAGDGRYGATLLIPAGADPQIDIGVLRKPLFQGSWSELEELVSPTTSSWKYLLLLLAVAILIVVAYAFRRSMN